MNRRVWFSLLGVSIAEVVARTVKWFINDSICERGLKISGWSDPLWILLIKKKYFQQEQSLELLLSCTEVMMKNWDVYTESNRHCSKEK